ncbi:hypothetical protein GQ457_13G005720 [Hibiscus cannabinus]
MEKYEEIRDLEALRGGERTWLKLELLDWNCNKEFQAYVVVNNHMDGRLMSDRSEENVENVWSISLHVEKDIDRRRRAAVGATVLNI